LVPWWFPGSVASAPGWCVCAPEHLFVHSLLFKGALLVEFQLPLAVADGASLLSDG